MRFRELQLIRYGRFEDCVLTFPATTCDLQLVFGPNEAGKSTTLKAVSDLLFGFPHVTPFAFRFDRQLLRVGAVIEDVNGSFSVRRRKGTSQTLLDSNDDPVDPSRLTVALGAQNRESFERMFGLDHSRLREGGQAMLDARDDVGQALFAAGSGLLQVTKVCEALEAEAKQIWTPRAGESRSYTAAARFYQDARVRLRDVQVRPAAWTQARRTLGDVEDELTALRADRATLQTDGRTLERRRRTLVPVARLQAALARLATLGDLQELPFDAGERFETALQAAQHAESDIARARAVIVDIEETLTDARPDTAILALREDIEALREAKGAADQDRMSLPQRRAKCEALQAQASVLQAEIGWPAEDAAAARRRLPGRPALTEVRELLEKHSGIDRQLAGAREGLDEAGATAGRLREQLAALPHAPSTAELHACLRSLREDADVAVRVQAAEGVREELKEILSSRLVALKPWAGTIGDLRGLPVPADADIDAASDQIDVVRERLAAARAARVTEADRLEQQRLEREQAALAHPAPLLEDLEAARQSRQAAWEPIRDHVLQGDALATPDVVLDRFVERVIGADQLADLRFERAEHAGGLAALGREVDKAELRLRQAETRVSEADADVRAASGAFDRLVAPLGFAISAEAYAAWHDDFGAALEAGVALDAAERDLQAARVGEAVARHGLLKVMGETDDTMASGPFRELLAAAERRFASATELQTQRERLEAQIETAATGEQRGRTQIRAAEAALETWTMAWSSALKELGFPVEAGLASVRSRLDLIETLRSQLDDILTLCRDIAEAECNITRFDDQVMALTHRLGRAPGGVPGEVLQVLHQDVQDAIVQTQRAQDLANQLHAARALMDAGEAVLADAETDLSPFITLVTDGDAIAVRAIIARAQEGGQLRRDIQAIEDEIVGLGEGRALLDLINDADGADADDLAAKAMALADAIQALNQEIEACSGRREAAAMAFNALDDRPDAAIAAFEMAEARSEMAFQAELYIRKRAEAKLLRGAIDRYRAEKQAPLLSRASILFQTLTLGRYARLLVEYEGDAPRLAGLCDDGATVVPVQGMSQGTIDQLFLALRIAAVEDAVAQGARMPFLADDLFINFDDERAVAGFKVLGELARTTQVLFFTHHEHLTDLARTALDPVHVSTCALQRETAALA